LHDGARTVGATDGRDDGKFGEDGVSEGEIDGTFVGYSDGTSEGDRVGVVDGAGDGAPEGTVDGFALVGLSVGGGVATGERGADGEFRSSSLVNKISSSSA
jgi:hypothetical protein